MLILDTPGYLNTEGVNNQEENLLLRNYNEIAHKYLKPKIIEGLLSLGIIALNIEFSPEDFPHSWQNGNFDIFCKWGDPPIEEQEEWDEGVVLPEENRSITGDFSNLVIVNGKKIFPAPDCIVCVSEKPSILFCNCGHVPICSNCMSLTAFNRCPMCNVVCDIKRNLTEHQT